MTILVTGAIGRVGRPLHTYREFARRTAAARAA